MAIEYLSRTSRRTKREIIIFSFSLLVIKFYKLSITEIPSLGISNLKPESIIMILSVLIVYSLITYIISAYDDYQNPDEDHATKLFGFNQNIKENQIDKLKESIDNFCNDIFDVIDQNFEEEKRKKRSAILKNYLLYELKSIKDRDLYSLLKNISLIIHTNEIKSWHKFINTDTKVSETHLISKEMRDFFDNTLKMDLLELSEIEKFLDRIVKMDSKSHEKIINLRGVLDFVVPFSLGIISLVF